MREYIAFDSHKRYTIMERENQQTSVARQRRIEHAPGAICGALRDCEPGTPVAIEATGNWYWIISEIEQAGLRPLLVHPRKAKLMMGLINKTDQLDADVIAEFARTQAPPAWRPTAPEIRELQELVHEYDSLQAARHQEQNRLKSGVQSDGVRNLLTQQVAFLDTQLATVLQLIEDLINHHPDLKQRQDLLTSIPGIATLTAAKLQAMELQRFDNARAATAFVGLNPMQRDSGSSVHGRPRYCSAW